MGGHRARGPCSPETVPHVQDDVENLIGVHVCTGKYRPAPTLTASEPGSERRRRKGRDRAIQRGHNEESALSGRWVGPLL